MLDPAGLGVYLRKGVLRYRDGHTLRIKNYGTRTRRSLIERDNITVHLLTSILILLISLQFAAIML